MVGGVTARLPISDRPWENPTREYDRMEKGTVLASRKDFDAAGIGADQIFSSPPGLLKEMEENPEQQYKLQITKYSETMPVLRPMSTLLLAIVGAAFGAEGMADTVDTTKEDFSKVRNFIRKHGAPDSFNGFFAQANDYVISKIPDPTKPPPEPPKTEEIDAKVTDAQIVDVMRPLRPEPLTSTTHFDVEDQAIPRTLKRGGKKSGKTEIEPGDVHFDKARMKKVDHNSPTQGLEAATGNSEAYAKRAKALSALPPGGEYRVEVNISDTTSANFGHNYTLSGARMVSDRVLSAQAYYDHLMQQPGAKKEDVLKEVDRMFGLSALGKTLGVAGSDLEVVDTLVGEGKGKGLDAVSHLTKPPCTLRQLILDHGDQYSQKIKLDGAPWGGTGEKLWEATLAANEKAVVQYGDYNRSSSVEGSQNQWKTVFRGATMTIVPTPSSKGFESTHAVVKGVVDGTTGEDNIKARRAAMGLLGEYVAGTQANLETLRAEKKEMIGRTNLLLGNFDRGMTPGDYKHNVLELTEMVGEKNAYLILSGKKAGFVPPLPPDLKLPAKAHLPNGVDSPEAFSKWLDSTGIKREKHTHEGQDVGRLGVNSANITSVEGLLKEQTGIIESYSQVPGKSEPLEAMKPAEAEGYFYARSLDQVESGLKQDWETVGKLGNGVGLSESGRKAVSGNVGRYEAALDGVERWAKTQPETEEKKAALVRIKDLRDGKTGVTALSSRLTSVQGSNEVAKVDGDLNTGLHKVDNSPVVKGKGKAKEKPDLDGPAKLEQADTWVDEAGDLAREGKVAGPGGAAAKYAAAAGVYRDEAEAAAAEAKKAAAAGDKEGYAKAIKRYDDAVRGMKRIADEANGWAQSLANVDYSKPGSEQKFKDQQTLLGVAIGTRSSIPSISGKPIVTQDNLSDLALEVETARVELGNLKKGRAEAEKKGDAKAVAEYDKKIEKAELKVKILEKDYNTGRKSIHDPIRDIRSNYTMEGWDMVAAGLMKQASALMQWSQQMLQKAGRDGSVPIDFERIFGPGGELSRLTAGIAQVATRKRPEEQDKIDKDKAETQWKMDVDNGLARAKAKDPKAKPLPDGHQVGGTPGGESSMSLGMKARRGDMGATEKLVQRAARGDETAAGPVMFVAKEAEDEKIKAKAYEGVASFAGAGDQKARDFLVERAMAGDKDAKSQLEKIKASGPNQSAKKWASENLEVLQLSEKAKGGDAEAATELAKKAKAGDKLASRALGEAALAGNKEAVRQLSEQAKEGDTAAVMVLAQVAKEGKSPEIRKEATEKLSDLVGVKDVSETARTALAELAKSGDAEARKLIEAHAKSDQVPEVQAWAKGVMDKLPVVASK